jgi:hypothetical protein
MKKTDILVLASLVAASSQIASAQTGEVSFTPTGFKFPIMKITMGQNNGSVGTATNINNEQVLYQCSGSTAAACLVDLTSQTALDQISAVAQGVSVDQGTYNILSLYSCPDGSSGSDTTTVYVKGQFTTNGTTYYTDPTNILNTSGNPDFTPIANWGCSTHSIILANPVTVGTASTTPTPTASTTPLPTVALDLPLTVLVDATYMANSIPTTSGGEGGCVAPSGGGRGICVNIPAVIPYAGTGTATSQRFLLAHNSASQSAVSDSQANAIVIVPSAGGIPLSVFAGPYFSSTSVPGGPNLTSCYNTSNCSSINPVTSGPTYNTSTQIQSFTVNADGSIAFIQGGSLDTNAGVFTDFQLQTHYGIVKSQDGTESWYYHAVQQ